MFRRWETQLASYFRGRTHLYRDDDLSTNVSIDRQVHHYMSGKVTVPSLPEGKPSFWTRSERRLCLPCLLLGAICVYICRQALPIAAPDLSNHQGWSKSQTGTALSSFFWGYMCTQIPAGYISDRIGGISVATYAACVWVPLTLILPVLVSFSPSNTATLWLIIAYRVMLGALQGFYYPCIASILSKRVDKAGRAFSYALCASGTQFGVLFSGGAGSILLEYYGWQSVFYVMGAIGMAWLVLMITVVLPLDKQKSSQLAGLSAPEMQQSIPWGQLLPRAAFWAVIIGHICNNNAYFILVSWLPTYFKETFPEEKGWVYNVIPWIAAVPCRWSGGYLADRLIFKGYSATFVRKFMTCLGIMLPALGLLLIANTQEFSTALLLLALSLGLNTFHSGGIMVTPQDIAPSHAGAVFGVMNSAGSIPGFVGVYFAGYILETTKSWAAVFYRTSLVSMFGWLVFMVFGSAKQIVP